MQFIKKLYTMSIFAQYGIHLQFPNVAKHLSFSHEKYVFPADKAPNNIIFVCKSYYIDLDYLIKQLGIGQRLNSSWLLSIIESQ